MTVWSHTLLSVAIVGVLPLFTLLFLRREENVRRIIPGLVALAVGALLGGAMLELLPEAFARLGPGVAAPLWMLAGFLAFFMMETLLHTHRRVRAAGTPHVRPYAILALIGDATHNVMDGMIIAASYLAGGGALGAATTLAVVLHEIPHELGDFGTLVHAGISMRGAVWLNFAMGLGAVLGAVLTLAIGDRATGFANALLPIAAGNFLYVAASDLVPELQREYRRPVALGQVALVLVGLGLVSIPLLFD